MTLCEQIPSRSYLRRARHRRTAALYSVPATRFLHGWLPQSFFTPRVKLELTKLPPDKSATSTSLAAVGVSGSHTRVHTNATHITHITHTHTLHTHITHTCNTYYKHPPIPFKGGKGIYLFTSNTPCPRFMHACQRNDRARHTMQDIIPPHHARHRMRIAAAVTASRSNNQIL